MYDHLLISDKSLKNHYENGKATGVEIKVKIGYYRGIPLSLFQDAYVVINGEKFERDRLKFAVREYCFTFDEMETVTKVSWNFAEEGTLIVDKPGGLEPGKTYDVEVMENIRVFYFPFPNISKCSKQLVLE
jgi:hypothetical protein